MSPRLAGKAVSVDVEDGLVVSAVTVSGLGTGRGIEPEGSGAAEVMPTSTVESTISVARAVFGIMAFCPI